MRQKITVFTLILSIVFNFQFSYASPESEKLAIYPLMKIVSLFEKYKNTPQDLFNNELKDHKFSKDLSAAFLKNNMKTLPKLSREGYFLVFGEGDQKVKIFARDAAVGLFVINGQVFSLNKYEDFNAATAALKSILKPSSSASILDLFFPKAEAGTVTRIVNDLLSLELFPYQFMVVVMGTSMTVLAMGQSSNKAKFDVEDPACVDQIKKLDVEKLPSSKASLQRLTDEYNKLNDKLFAEKGIRHDAILVHVDYYKALKEFALLDCDSMLGRTQKPEQCERLRTSYKNELRRLALQEERSSDRRRNKTWTDDTKLTTNNAKTLRDCMNFYDMSFWKVFSRLSENEKKEVGLYIDKESKLQIASETPAGDTLKKVIPPTGNSRPSLR